MRLLRDGSLLFELEQYAEAQQKIAELRKNSPEFDAFLTAIQTDNGNWPQVREHIRGIIKEIETPNRPLFLGLPEHSLGSEPQRLADDIVGASVQDRL